MINKSNNFAYIDGANLDKALKNHLKWKLDYRRFRVWLKEKYGVKRAYVFIGYIPKYKSLYDYLRTAGFTLIFKEVVFDKRGLAKGNCDADLVLRAVIDCYEKLYDCAMIVTSDGDYVSLARFLLNKNKLLTILSPADEKRCSILLKRFNAKIVYLGDKKNILSAIKRKNPR